MDQGSTRYGLGGKVQALLDRLVLHNHLVLPGAAASLQPVRLVCCRLWEVYVTHCLRNAAVSHALDPDRTGEWRFQQPYRKLQCFPCKSGSPAEAIRCLILKSVDGPRGDCAKRGTKL